MSLFSKLLKDPTLKPMLSLILIVLIIILLYLTYGRSQSEGMLGWFSKKPKKPNQPSRAKRLKNWIFRKKTPQFNRSNSTTSTGSGSSNRSMASSAKYENPNYLAPGAQTFGPNTLVPPGTALKGRMPNNVIMADGSRVQRGKRLVVDPKTGNEVIYWLADRYQDPRTGLNTMITPEGNVVYRGAPKVAVRVEPGYGRADGLLPASDGLWLVNDRPQVTLRESSFG